MLFSMKSKKMKGSKKGKCRFSRVLVFLEALVSVVDFQGARRMRRIFEDSCDDDNKRFNDDDEGCGARLN